MNHRNSPVQIGGSRRPVPGRGSPIVTGLARGLIRIGLHPNHVSLLSILFAGLSALAMITGAGFESLWQRALLLAAAAALILIRSICNLVDGLMAVEGGMKSPAGEIYNDLPDRVSDLLMLVGAGTAIGTMEGIAAGMAATILALLAAYVRVLGAAAGAGHDFRGPMAKPHRMLVIAIASLITILEPALGWSRGNVLRIALALVIGGCLITIIRRLHHIVRRLNARTS